MSGFAYDRTTGILSFNASCGSATRISIFIAELRSSGIFSDVNYSGYSGGTVTVPGEPQTASDGAITETEVTVTEYTFNVSCRVNTDEQREVAEAAAKNEKEEEKAEEEQENQEE
jgi:hypothetical protein